MRCNVLNASTPIAAMRKKKGWSENQLMEAVHVAAGIKGGAALVRGVQMMNKVKEIAM